MKLMYSRTIRNAELNTRDVFSENIYVVDWKVCRMDWKISAQAECNYINTGLRRIYLFGVDFSVELP